MNSDFKDLLRALSESGAKFLIIGGYAVIRYTEPRYTKDLDILIEPSIGNAELVLKALQAFGAPLFTLSAQDLTVAGNFFQIGVPPNRIDIIVSVPGVDFPAVYARSERSQLVGLEVPGFPAKILYRQNWRQVGRKILWTQAPWHVVRHRQRARIPNAPSYLEKRSQLRSLSPLIAPKKQAFDQQALGSPSYHPC